MADELGWWLLWDSWQLVGWAVLAMLGAVYVGGVLALWLAAVTQAPAAQTAAERGQRFLLALYAPFWPLSVGARAADREVRGRI